MVESGIDRVSHCAVLPGIPDDGSEGMVSGGRTCHGLSPQVTKGKERMLWSRVHAM